MPRALIVLLIPAINSKKKNTLYTKTLLYNYAVTVHYCIFYDPAYTLLQYSCSVRIRYWSFAAVTFTLRISVTGQCSPHRRHYTKISFSLLVYMTCCECETNVLYQLKNSYRTTSLHVRHSSNTI